MRANWKQCRHYKSAEAGWVALYVSLNKTGRLHFGRRIFEKLGEPEALEIYFDDVNNRFGLKPARLSSRDAYRVLKRGPRGGRQIHMSALLKEFRIDLPETIQFHDPHFDDEGILVLDLRTARASNRARNYRKNSRNKDKPDTAEPPASPKD